jgi:hypothetical protein
MSKFSRRTPLIVEVQPGETGRTHIADWFSALWLRFRQRLPDLAGASSEKQDALKQASQDKRLPERDDAFYFALLHTHL